MAKLYMKKVSKEHYLKNGILNKIKKAIKLHQGMKYIHIKKVISKDDAQRCIFKMESVQKFTQIQKNRLYDRYVYMCY
jgi:hypothetical protein